MDPDDSEHPDVSKRLRPSSSRQKYIAKSDSDENNDDCVDDGNGDGAATDAEDAACQLSIPTRSSS